MQEIKKYDLNNLYGIDLPIGLYDIEFNNGNYIISIIRDDTEGCLLVGENKVKGKVINSTKYEIELVNRIKEAISYNEEIWITIE